jgi:hypothetical protein
MLPAARTGAHGNETVAPDVARSRSRTTVTAASRATTSSRPGSHRADTTVASPVPQTGALLLAGMPPAEQAAILQAAKEQLISELFGDCVNADEGHMDDDDESYDDDDEEQYESKLLADAFAPVAQALARLEAAVAFRADQQVSLVSPPLRGIHLIVFDVRQAQASFDLAKVAGNAALIQVELSLLAAFQIELSATLARLQQVSLALPPLRGIHLIAFDIRQAQASIDLANVAGNTSLVQVEQSLLAAFQIELSKTLARVRR